MNLIYFIHRWKWCYWNKDGALVPPQPTHQFFLPFWAFTVILMLNSIELVHHSISLHLSLFSILSVVFCTYSSQYRFLPIWFTHAFAHTLASFFKYILLVFTVHLIYSFVERLERRIFPEGVLPIRDILIFKNFGISNCACSHVVPTASLVSERISYSWTILWSPCSIETLDKN